MEQNINIGYALVNYMGTLPEGHVLREIAERTLHDYNKREIIYVDAEINDAYCKRKYRPAFRKSRASLKELHSTLVQNINYLILKHNKTIEIFARELEAKRYDIQNIKRGRAWPSIRFLLLLSDKYGYTIEFLVTELIKDQKK